MSDDEKRTPNVVVAAELAMHYQDAGRAQREGKIVACSCGFDGNYVTWRAHVADAVLDTLGLEQVGWHSAKRHAAAGVTTDGAIACLLFFEEAPEGDWDPVYRLTAPGAVTEAGEG